ncbi:hypothetical protein FNYG_02814 [Fusarium nygamai]|uniref:Beta-glucuronidase C-terminal domain-containing protein n=1 Tax=Gibberella nygamai TaxID=42673 RepID=A0A2K0WPB3_GIBNY|nr:hypothetical protein FNYG_02814 [Fusarium nygamai]
MMNRIRLRPLKTDDKPIRVLLYNSDYYTTGTRSSQTFALTGLCGFTVSAKRLIAAASTSRVDAGQSPTVAGQTFENGSRKIQGQSTVESATVLGG